MRKLLSKLFLASVSFILLGVLVTPVKAINLDEAWMKVLNAIGVAERTESDQSDCVNFKYVGASTQAVVAIAATTITAYEPYNVASTEFGTAAGAYTLTNAAYDTMGELCDAIEALPSYKCELRGCKRDDDSRIMRDLAATNGGFDLQVASGFTSKLDSGSSDTTTGNQFVYVLRIGIVPAADRRVLLKQCVANANVAGSFRVLGQLRKFESAYDGVTRNDSTKVWQAATANNTDLTQTFSVSGVGGLEFAKNAHVVISAGNGTTITTAQAAANFMTCSWEER